MNQNPNSKSEKKTNTKKIAGGTKTTIIGANGNKTIIYEGVGNLHIGRTFHHTFPTTSSSQSHSKAPTSRPNDASSKTVKTGVTFQQVDSLYLNSKQIKEISHQTPPITFASSKDYKVSKSSSSKSTQGTQQPSQTTSFKH